VKDNNGRAVKGGRSAHLPWAVDTGRRVQLKLHGLIRLAAPHGLFRRAELSLDAALMLPQDPADQQDPGSHGYANESLPHGLEPEARPESARLNGRDDPFSELT
jgi:hypothetical protein